MINLNFKLTIIISLITTNCFGMMVIYNENCGLYRPTIFCPRNTCTSTNINVISIEEDRIEEHNEFSSITTEEGTIVSGRNFRRENGKTTKNENFQQRIPSKSPKKKSKRQQSPLVRTFPTNNPKKNYIKDLASNLNLGAVATIGLVALFALCFKCFIQDENA